jgi:hypothetical protein
MQVLKLMRILLVKLGYTHVVVRTWSLLLILIQRWKSPSLMKFNEGVILCMVTIIIWKGGGLWLGTLLQQHADTLIVLCVSMTCYSISQDLVVSEITSVIKSWHS